MVQRQSYFGKKMELMSVGDRIISLQQPLPCRTKLVKLDYSRYLDTQDTLRQQAQNNKSIEITQLYSSLTENTCISSQDLRTFGK